MRLTLFKLTAIVIACAGWSGSLCGAQEKSESSGPVLPRRSPGRVAEVMPWQAEANIKARLETLRAARIKAIELRGGLIDQDIIEELVKDEQDGTGPVRWRKVVARSAFDRFAFGSMGNAESARAHGEAVLAQLIDQMDHVRKLTPVEKQKLLLAGRGDLKRLFDRIEDRRRTFESLRTDVDRCRELLGTLEPLHRRLVRGPFEAESLFFKTLKKFVNEDKRRRGGEEVPTTPRLEPTAIVPVRGGFTGR